MGWRPRHFFFGALLYFVYRSTCWKRVFLQEGRIRVASLFRAVEIGLDEVLDVEWIQKPVNDMTPEAALVLRTPCLFGDEIRFIPRTPQTVGQLKQALEAHRSAKHA